MNKKVSVKLAIKIALAVCAALSFVEWILIHVNGQKLTAIHQIYIAELWIVFILSLIGVVICTEDTPKE